MPPEPIVIVTGLPRSGTSLAMQMLVAGGMKALTDGAREADPDNPRGYFELEAVKRLPADTSWLDGAHGRVVKVIHALVAHLPDDRDYRVLFMRRDTQEVVRSQATMLARWGHAGSSLSPERLAAVYETQLASLSAWLTARPRFTVLQVSYPALVGSPANEAAAINRFLGGTLDEAAMAAAVDPNLYRNRSKSVS